MDQKTVGEGWVDLIRDGVAYVRVLIGGSPLQYEGEISVDELATADLNEGDHFLMEVEGEQLVFKKIPRREISDEERKEFQKLLDEELPIDEEGPARQVN